MESDGLVGWKSKTIPFQMRACVRELDELLRFLLDQRQITVESPSYAILAWVSSQL